MLERKLKCGKMSDISGRIGKEIRQGPERKGLSEEESDMNSSVGWRESSPGLHATSARVRQWEK